MNIKDFKIAATAQAAASRVVTGYFYENGANSANVVVQTAFNVDGKPSFIVWGDGKTQKFTTSSAYTTQSHAFVRSSNAVLMSAAFEKNLTKLTLTGTNLVWQDSLINVRNLNISRYPIITEVIARGGTTEGSSFGLRSFTGYAGKSSLVKIDVGDNRLGWTIGGGFSFGGIEDISGCTNLETFNVDQNYLHTYSFPLPDPGAGTNNKLKDFRVDYNFINGTFPTYINKYTSLRDFRCGHNLWPGSSNSSSQPAWEAIPRGTNTGVTGSITGVTLPTSLKRFECQWNHITGTFPSMAACNLLEIVNIQHCDFTNHLDYDGVSPHKLPPPNGVLKDFQANYNYFTGNLPSSLLYPNLRTFVVHHNRWEIRNKEDTGPSLDENSGIWGEVPSLVACPKLEQVEFHTNRFGLGSDFEENSSALASGWALHPTNTSLTLLDISDNWFSMADVNTILQQVYSKMGTQTYVRNSRKLYMTGSKKELSNIITQGTEYVLVPTTGGTTIFNRSGNTISVTTASNHGLTTGDLVAIDYSHSTTGITSSLNGAFQVNVTGLKTFTYTSYNTGPQSANGAYSKSLADMIRKPVDASGLYHRFLQLTINGWLIAIDNDGIGAIKLPT